jgi:hypothetical protein
MKIREIKNHGHGHVTVKIQKHLITNVDKLEQNQTRKLI